MAALGSQTGRSDYSLGVDREILAKASALVPLLHKNAERTELEKRVPDENVDALAAAGLWGLTRPRERGGFETNIRTVVEVISELGRGCGSTSWIVAVSSIIQWAISFLSEEAQTEIYELSPDPRFSATFAPTAKTERVDGGLRVTGRWGWVSGCEHAHWGFMGIPLFDENGKAAGEGQAMLKMADCKIEKTWNAAGLVGTSTHHVAAKDVFIADHMVLNVTEAARGNRTSAYPGSLYNAPFSPTECLIQGAPQPGIVEAAFDHTLAYVPEKPLTYTTFAKSKDAPTVEIDVARAAEKLSTAKLHMAAAADMIDLGILEGRSLSPAEHARARMASGTISRESREAIDHLLDACGASVFLLSNPIQRCWRDVSVASRHGYLLNTTNAQISGADLLGGPQIAPLL